MDTDHITVVYKWTAQPGKLDALTSIYEKVTEAMQQNEPDAEAVHLYVSQEENAIYVRDEFKDAAAMGFHLGGTAAAHFPALLEIATPGSFMFMGPVPEELKQATRQMGLAAEFSTHAAGFDR
jgi:quinol monooxygenase YgiN